MPPQRRRRAMGIDTVYPNCRRCGTRQSLREAVSGLPDHFSNHLLQSGHGSEIWQNYQSAILREPERSRPQRCPQCSSVRYVRSATGVLVPSYPPAEPLPQYVPETPENVHYGALNEPPPMDTLNQPFVPPEFAHRDSERQPGESHRRREPQAHRVPAVKPPAPPYHQDQQIAPLSAPQNSSKSSPEYPELAETGPLSAYNHTFTDMFSDEIAKYTKYPHDMNDPQYMRSAHTGYPGIRTSHSGYGEISPGDPQMHGNAQPGPPPVGQEGGNHSHEYTTEWLSSYANTEEDEDQGRDPTLGPNRRPSVA